MRLISLAKAREMVAYLLHRHQVDTCTLRRKYAFYMNICDSLNNYISI